MSIQRLPLLLVLCAASAFASDSARVASFVQLCDTADTARMRVSWKVREVRDLRGLAAKDPALLGTSSPLPFEERTPLRAARPVAEEVKALLDRILVSDSAFPVRIDLLSFETWTDPVPGPDPARARVMLRIVSLDSSAPGLLLEPRAQGERKVVPRPADQIALLKGLLKDALALARPPFRPSPDTGSAAPEPDRWADPSASPAPPPASRALRQILSGDAVVAVSGVGVGFRYAQYLEPPQGAWTPEYWLGAHLHGPWNDDEYAGVWSAELAGGMAWHRRLDAGASPWTVVGSLGGLVGFETSRPVHDDGSRGERKTFPQIGVEGRGLLRWQPRSAPGSSWAFGPQLALRVPSRLGWFDPAFVVQAGWRI